MSEDIKVLREAVGAFERKSRTVDYWFKLENTALAILCRREIERMEAEGRPAQIAIGTASLMPEYKFQEPDNSGGVAAYDDKRAALRPVVSDALSAARDEGWNAAIEAAANCVSPCQHWLGFDREQGPLGCSLDDKCICIGVSLAIRSLRKGPSND